jgi:hypothetical protein
LHDWDCYRCDLEIWFVEYQVHLLEDDKNETANGGGEDGNDDSEIHGGENDIGDEIDDCLECEHMD